MCIHSALDGLVPVLLEFAAARVREFLRITYPLRFGKALPNIQNSGKADIHTVPPAGAIGLRNFSLEEIVEPEPIFYFPALKTERFSREILFLISRLKGGSYM